MQSKKKPTNGDLVERPYAHFEAPQEIVETQRLSLDEKRKALENWEQDARRLSVATEEGMEGGEPARLTEVAEAKAKLGIDDETRRSSPTKVG